MKKIKLLLIFLALSTSLYSAENDHELDIEYLKFFSNCDEYGILKDFANDPMYEVIIKDLEPSSKPQLDIIEYLFQRQVRFNEIKNKLWIINPTLQVKNFIYSLIDIEKEGFLRTVQHLAHNLSSDHTNKDFRYIYRNFYFDNGLPKLYDIPREFQEISMAPLINTAKHAEDRILFFKLLACHEELSVYHIIAINQGINFLQRSLFQDSLASIYRSLAESSYHAVQQSNPFALKNYSQQPQSKLQKDALRVISTLYSTLYNEGSNISTPDQTTLKDTIEKLDDLFGKTFEEQKREHAEKSLEKILESIAIASAPHNKFAAEAENPTAMTLEEAISQVVLLENLDRIGKPFKTEPQRTHAYLQYKAEGDVRSPSIVPMNETAKRFLGRYGIYARKLVTMNANAIQKQIQQEFVAIAEKTAQDYSRGSTNYTVINAQLTGLGIECIIENNIPLAHIIATCCHQILDNIEDWINSLSHQEKNALIYLKAFNARNTETESYTPNITDINNYPIETALTGGDLEIRIPYQIRKMIMRSLMAAHENLLEITYSTPSTDKIKASFEDRYQFFLSILVPDIEKK